MVLRTLSPPAMCPPEQWDSLGIRLAWGGGGSLLGLGPVQTCESEPVQESDPCGLDFGGTTLASRVQQRDFLRNEFNRAFLSP